VVGLGDDGELIFDHENGFPQAHLLETQSTKSSRVIGLAVVAIILVCLTAGLIFIAPWPQRISALFVGFFIGSVLAPSVNLNVRYTWLWIIVAAVWFVNEVVIGFLGGAEARLGCAVLLVLPTLYAGLQVLFAAYELGVVHQNPPRSLQALGIVSIAGMIAYLAPYALATVVERYPIQAIGGAFQISMASGWRSPPPYNEYLLGSYSAGIASIILVFLMTLIGKLALAQVVPKKEKYKGMKKQS
jgi:MFS family permease